MFIQNRAESRAFFYNVWKKQKRVFAKYSSYLIKDKDTTLILILIGINFSNVL